MKRIFKYQLDLKTGPQPVLMPLGANIVHVNVQTMGTNAWIMFWAEVPSRFFDETTYVDRYFQVIPTGFETIDDDALYLGTAHHNDTVWHVYEVGS